MLELKGVVATCKLFPTEKKDHEKIKTSNLTSESAHLSMAQWILRLTISLAEAPNRGKDYRRLRKAPEAFFSGGGL